MLIKYMHTILTVMGSDGRPASTLTTNVPIYGSPATRGGSNARIYAWHRIWRRQAELLTNFYNLPTPTKALGAGFKSDTDGVTAIASDCLPSAGISASQSLALTAEASNSCGYKESTDRARASPISPHKLDRLCSRIIPTHHIQSPHSYSGPGN